MKPSVILDILALVAVYGIPAVRDVVKAWEKDEVMPDDIAELEALVKRPDAYGPRA